MVSSNKKKRGQQRKAAKQQTTASTSAVSPENQLVVYTPNGTYIHPNHHTLTAMRFRLGSGSVTDILLKLTSDDVPTQGISWPNISLDQSGILSSTLHGFLKKCEDETFEALISNVGGDLKSPSLWIKVLLKAVELEPSCMGEIVKNIGPLIRCMCNDTKRLFFKSNKHWQEGILPFVQLVSDMVCNSTDWEVVKTLLKNEGLLASIIQWIFWDEHRPDLVDELSMEKCTGIADLGTAITVELLANAAYNPSAEDGQLLGRIGCVPIVSKDYNPHCRLSYMVELINFIKGNEMKEREREHLKILQSLLYTGDCIDKDVIMGVIDLGTNHAHDYDSAVAVAGLSAGILRKGSKDTPSDTRVAFAIRTGLLEMCLNLVDCFGGHGSFCDEDKLLYNHIESIFYIINDISLHQKTAKAIRSKRIVTEDKLVRLTDTITENDIATNDMSTAIIYNDKCKDLLDMARSILNLNGLYCCRCNKSLRKTEVKQCNGCGRMSYCSRACQREDWLNGHKLTCNKLCTNNNMGLFQGRLQPETVELPDSVRASTKLIELEVNVNMIQLKLFLDHSDVILNQAKALGTPLCDCGVLIDLRRCPPIIKTVKYAESRWSNKESFESSKSEENITRDKGHFESEEEKKGFEASRSKDNITCIYTSKTFFGDNALDQNGEVVQSIQMQRLFPHEWLTQKSNQISDGDKSKQIIGKQICQKAETVNNESYTKDDNLIGKHIGINREN